MIGRLNASWLARLDAHDARALGYLVERRHPHLNRAVRRITRLGDPPVIVLISALLLLMTEGAQHAAAVIATVALVTSHVLVQLLKRAVSRPRPRLPVGLGSLIEAPDRFSFPSGHAAAAFAVAAGMAPAVGPAAGAAILGLGLLVGLSRCYLGVHYPGDVVMGWALAAAGLVLAGFIV